MKPEELKAALDAGQPVKLIDVRSPAEYAEVHIDGSHLVPLSRLNADAVKATDAHAEACVLVCRSGRRAEQARRKLAAAGGVKLHVLEGGVDAWTDADYPVHRGKAAISLERQVRIAAGFLVLAGVVGGTSIHPGFFGLSAFVGAGLMFAGITDWCGMALLIGRMPWNQRAATS